LTLAPWTPGRPPRRPDPVRIFFERHTCSFTGKTVNLGPIPDNQSSGDAKTDTTFGFGTHQGLAVYDGKIYAAWSSNLNGSSDGKADGTSLLDIRTATASFAAGPRIIASTMGAVGNPGDTVNVDRNPDGSPIADAFTVTFDRPIDPNSFTNSVAASDVTVTYQDTTSGDPPVTLHGVSVTQQSATTFLVKFQQLSQVNPTVFNKTGGVGTYSYAISSAHIQDQIETETVNGTSTGDHLDQNNNGAHAGYAAPAPAASSSFSGAYDQNTLPMIVPGPHIVSTTAVSPQAVTPATPDNLVLNGAVSGVTVTFDRNMNPNSFTAANVLRVMGPAGLVAGPLHRDAQRDRPQDLHRRVHPPDAQRHLRGLDRVALLDERRRPARPVRHRHPRQRARHQRERGALRLAGDGQTDLGDRLGHL
jgi:hypothetical protein